ncbi:hypothetical protein [Mesorhizobium salmacidum]|uniref:Uncharacterized protein n=1 Tax=Mesorhizobium salmacidum TaxID=3015171 RepID=A0ABU8L343_9HYPH
MRRIIRVAIALGLLVLFVAARAFVSPVDHSAPATATAPSADQNHNATTEADDRAVKDNYDYICLSRWFF